MQQINSSSNYHQPTLTCIQNQQAVYLCAQYNCKNNPLLCIKQKCKCHQNHQQTCSIKAKINKIISPIYQIKNSPFLAKAIKQVQQVFQNLIQLISQQRDKVIQQVQLLVLHQNQNQLFKIIDQKQIQKLSGDLIFNVYNQRRKPKPKIQNLVNQQNLNICQKSSQSIIQKCTSSISKHFGIILSQSITNIVDSKILSTKEEMNTLRMLFNNKLINLQFLYRASQHDFKSKDFHDKCDGVKKTVTLVLTEYGKKVGGYNALEWNGKGSAVQDKQGQCFVFSLDQKQRYECNDKPNALLCYSSNGPTFGKAQSDIYLPNDAHKSNCNFNIGTSYGKQALKDVKQKHKLFCGAESGYQSKVKQYEVFKVTLAE